MRAERVLFTPRAKRLLFACPNINQLAFLGSKKGYIFDVISPYEKEEIPLAPIIEVVFSLEERIVIFTDFTHACAYGPDGLIWRSLTLSWDGFRDLEIHNESLRAKVWDSPNGTWAELELNIRTGEVLQGISPSE